MQKLLIIILTISSNYLIGMNPQIVAQAVAAAQLVLIQKEQAKENKRKADQQIEDPSRKKLKTVLSAADIALEDSAKKNKKKCEVCGKFYANGQVLKIHMRIHTGEKPFKCDYCDYEARHKHALVEHKRIHTGEKPHKCDLCGFLCARSSNMNSHKKICNRNGNSSEKTIISADGKYAVESGDSNSVKNTKLIKLKNRFTCEECGTCFATDTFLKLHKTVHAKNTNQEVVLEPIYNNGLFTVSDDETEQPNIATELKARCDVCGKLVSKNNLSQHKKVHEANRKKEFACTLCAKSFMWSQSLTRHMIKHATTSEVQEPLKNKFVAGPEITVAQYPLLSKMFEGKNIVDMYNSLEILQKISFQTKIVDALEQALSNNSRESNIALLKEVNSFLNAHTNDLIPLTNSRIQEKLNEIKLRLGPI